MGRPPCCDKTSVKKGPWTPEEDAKLLAYVSTLGSGNWTSVPKKAGLKRCGKSCRLRYTNYLRPDLKRESFTSQEEQIIIYLHGTIGSRWAAISNYLPGRTDNDVKNYWNTKLKKKLYQRGIDPITHKPISQIINSLGGLPIAPTAASSGSSAITTTTATTTKTRGPRDARISCLNRELKNMFLSRSESIMDPVVGLIQNVPDTSAGCDLLAQLHAIKLVADMSNAGLLPLAPPQPPPPPPQLPMSCMVSYFSPSEASLEASSSSSNAAPPPCDELDWSDFLVDDVIIDIDDKENVHKAPSSTAGSSSSSRAYYSSSSKQVVQLTSGGDVEQCELTGDAAADEVFGAADAAFMESLLSNDIVGMEWEFPESILGDPFDFTQSDAL